jgi:hypothetical protein
MTIGFQEEPTKFEGQPGDGIVGQIRRLGSAGPAYEIMKVDQNGDVHIEIIVSGEKVVFPLAEVMEDPMAETIP